MKRARKRERAIRTGYDPEPMRILHVSTPKTWRGGEQQLAYLVQGLEDQGVQQTVLGPKGSVLEEHSEKKGWPFAAFARKGPLNLGIARELKGLVRSCAPDLIHAHDAHAHTAAFLASSILRVPLPIVVHRRVDFPVGRHFLSRWKFDHRRVARVIAVSEATRRIGMDGVKEKHKWVTVHSGVDPDRIQARKDPGRLRKELGLSSDMPLVGNVAALADHKDHSTFLHAAKDLLERKGEGRFVIIGEGPERASVEEGIEDLGLEGKVFLLGYRQDVPELLSDFDIFLMSSKTEGLGTSLLDAMAASVPVLSTNAGGIPEIVEDGVNGVLRDVGDHRGLAQSLMKLLGDEELRGRLIANGLKTAHERSYSRMAQEVLEVYKAVLEKHGG